MSVDLKALSDKLKAQRNVGVRKDGQVTEKDPENDGSKMNTGGQTTLKPKKFFVSRLLKWIFSR